MSVDDDLNVDTAKLRQRARIYASELHAALGAPGMTSAVAAEAFAVGYLAAIEDARTKHLRARASRRRK